MYKLVQTKKRMTFGEENATIVLKGDFLPMMDSSTDVCTIRIQGKNYEKPTKDFDEVGEVPEYITKFSHVKVQQFMKLFNVAKEQGYKFSPTTWGAIHPTATDSDSILSSFDDKYQEATEKEIIWISKFNQKELEPDAEYTTEGEPWISVYHKYQVVGVDFNEALDTTFLGKFTHFLTQLKQLTDEEKKDIQYKRMVREWAKVLKDKLSKVENQKRDSMTRIEDHRKSLIVETQNLRQALRDVTHIQTIMTEDAEALIQRAKEVAALPFVKDIETDNIALVVKFNDFEKDFMIDEEIYRVPFKDVVVKLYPKRVEITHSKCYESKRSDGSVSRRYYHMHIQGPDNDRSEQFACFGDHNDRMAVALAERRFTEVIFQCKNLLGSHNAGDVLLNAKKFLVGIDVAKITNKDDDDFDEDEISTWEIAPVKPVKVDKVVADTM